MAQPAFEVSGFLDALTATTRRKILPTVADNLYRSDPLFAMFKANNLKQWEGPQIQESFLYAPEGGDFYAPGATFNITQTQSLTAGNFQPKFLYVPVTVTLEETEVFNTGATEAIVSIIDTKMQNASYTMAARLAIALYQGGQGSRILALNGMEEILNDGSNAGFAGNTYANYGTVPRNGTIATALNSPMTGPTANVAGPVLYSTLERAYNSVCIGSSNPDVIVTTNLGMSYIKQKFQPQQRFETQDAKLGFNSLVFNQARIYQSQYAPGTVVPEFGAQLGFPTGLTGETIWFLNSKTFSLYERSGMFGMGFTGFKVAQDNNTISGQQLFAGNVTNIQPRLSRYLFNVQN